MDMTETSWKIIDDCVIEFQFVDIFNHDLDKNGIFSNNRFRNVDGVRRKFQLTFYLKENDAENFKVKLSRYDDIQAEIWKMLFNAPPKFHQIPNWSISFRIDDIPEQFSAMKDRLKSVRKRGLHYYDNSYIDDVDNDIFENLQGLHYKQRIDT